MATTEHTATGQWREVMLGDVAELIMGQSPPGSTYNESGDGLPFFQGVKDFNYRYPTPRVFCSEPTRIAQKGDILFSVRAPIGRVNVADRKCSTGRGLAIIRPHIATDARYLEYRLRSLESRWDALETSGSVFGNATKRDLESLPLSLPPLSEQRAIAHILGALDDKIELNRRMNETLEEMARALFKSWFVDFDPVRAKMEGRWRPGQSFPGLPADLYHLFPARLAPSELGQIPEGWEVKTLGDVVDVVGGATPSTKVAEYWDGGAHCWATPKDLSNLSSPVLLDTERKITDAGLDKISSGLLPPGTLLLSSRAPIGYLAISEAPVAINQGFIAMPPKEAISNLFLLYWCSYFHEQIINYANGSTFLEISKRDFRLIPIAMPGETIMKAFHSRAHPLHERIVSNERASRALAAQRDALLPRLVSGEVGVENPSFPLQEIVV